MRIVVFLLLFGNLLFFAWTQGYLGSTAGPDALRMEEQLQPEKLRIVARGEPPPVESKPEAKARKEEVACRQWPKLAAADADRLERFVAEKFPSYQVARSNHPGSVSYWVFIPPLASKQEADRKAAELKRLAVPEFYIVQDAGPNRLAISLGIFSSEEAAQARLEALRAKGLKSAKLGERNGEPARVTLEARGPAAQADALLQGVAESLPDPAPSNCAGAKP